MLSSACRSSLFSSAKLYPTAVNIIGEGLSHSSIDCIANETFTLPSDVHVSREYLGISTTHVMDPLVWPDRARFIGIGFSTCDRTQARQTHLWLSLTSRDNLGFGYNKMVCRDRHFVAGELNKIICHFLMRFHFQKSPTSIFASYKPPM